jgi:hypothetical protein
MWRKVGLGRRDRPVVGTEEDPGQESGAQRHRKPREKKNKRAWFKGVTVKTRVEPILLPVEVLILSLADLEAGQADGEYTCG